VDKVTESAGAEALSSELKSRVTISTLAQALGLTKGTVSKALNGYHDVSEHTRKRVELEARRLGYKPLSHAQAIRTGRCRALGLVLSVDAYDSSRPFLADFLDGVSRAASAEGWTLTIATANSDADLLLTMKRLIDDHKADGFILPRTLHDDPRIGLLNRSGVPFVLFGRSRDCDAYPWFDVLGEIAMAEAVSRLAAQGHKRIGFINASHAFEYARQRERGYAQGLKEAGMTVDRDVMLAGCHTAADGARGAKQLLSHSMPPTAIICATDIVALGVYQGAQELGLKIGADLSVIAYDGIPEGAFAHPGLTTFSTNNREAGERLASLLIAHIRGGDPKELQESTRATLQERASDGPPRLSSQELAEHLKSYL
jgi:LacI family transcriptional regulator